VLVVGDADVAAGTVGVNARGSNDPERDVPLAAFAERLAAEVDVDDSPTHPLLQSRQDGGAATASA
jgi:hypothetical protein